MEAAAEKGHKEGEKEVLEEVKKQAADAFKERTDKANPHDGTIWNVPADDCQREFPEGGCVKGVNNWLGTNQQKLFHEIKKLN